MTERTQTTRRVRVLVMIDPTGHWEALGSASYSDAEARSNMDDISGDMGPAPWGYHWIEADVPVPVEVDEMPIQGAVTNATI